VPYVVPQFLTTCEHTTKEAATNLGVRIMPTAAAMVAEVARAACEHHRRVPVLVITRGGEHDELQQVCRALVTRLARHAEVATRTRTRARIRTRTRTRIRARTRARTRTRTRARARTLTTDPDH